MKMRSWKAQAIDLISVPMVPFESQPDHSYGGRHVGLAHYSTDGWESFSSEDGFPSKDPTCLAVDREGAVWIGTEDAGLLKFFQGEWETFAQDDGLEGNEIDSLLIDEKDNLWIGTDVSAVVFDGENGDFETEDGLAHGSCL